MDHIVAIKFGVKYFTIRSFEPEEVGLKQSETDPYTVERCQRYLHIFWIPFFGLGKVWAFRKQSDKQLYEVEDSNLSVLKPYEKGLKTPLKTYAGTLLGIVGFIIFLCVLLGHDIFVNWESKDKFEAEKADLEQKIENPDTSDYYTFYVAGIEEEGTAVFKVAGYDESNVQLQSARVNPVEHVKVSSDEDYYVNLVFREQDEKGKIYSLQKEDLKKCLEPYREFDDYRPYINAYPLPVIHETAKFSLHCIDRFDRPKLDIDFSRSEGTSFYATIMNMGLGATIKKVEMEDGTVKVSAPDGNLIQTGESFSVDFETGYLRDFVIKILMEDEFGKVWNFELVPDGDGFVSIESKD